MAARNFKLFLGCLGNGVTVCNSAVMEDGDFKMVAHISNEGKITWYVGEDYPPADALASIRACAEQERVKYETWLNGLSPAARREYQLERLPPVLPVWMTVLLERCARESYPTLAVFSSGTSSSKSFTGTQKYFNNLPFCSCFPRARVV